MNALNRTAADGVKREAGVLDGGTATTCASSRNRADATDAALAVITTGAGEDAACAGIDAILHLTDLAVVKATQGLPMHLTAIGRFGNGLQVAGTVVVVLQC